MSKYSEKKFFNSFKFAVRGLAAAIKTQRNFRRQLIVAILTIIAIFLVGFPVGQLCILLLTVGFVLVAELFNSVIEFTIDAVFKNKYSVLAGAAKDMAAGAVCIASICAFTVGFIIFADRLLNFYGIMPL